jgi:hypothetical protein
MIAIPIARPANPSCLICSVCCSITAQTVVMQILLWYDRCFKYFIFCWTGSSPGAAKLHWLGVSIFCMVVHYLEAILQRIIITIVFVCVNPSNRSELLYRSRTTLQHFRGGRGLVRS